MRFRALFLGAAIAAATLIPSTAQTAVEWTPFSTAPVVNFADAALHRSSDGNLHVLWVQDDETGAEDLYQTVIDPAGRIQTVELPVLTDWASMWAGGGDLVPTADGKMRYFFGGLRTTRTGDENDNLSMLTSDSAGTSWSLHPQNVVDGGDGAAYATTIGAGTSLDMTPFQTFGGRLHRGTNANTGVIDVHDSIGGSCCAYDSDTTTDQVTGQMYFGWYSNADDKRGVWAHEINPTTGALVGAPLLMPGVTQATTAGGEPQASQANTRIPMTGRPGQAGVYFAYTGGYPITRRVLVWHVGDSDSVAVVQARDASYKDPAIASDPDGRLWVGWSRGSKLFFRRSSPDATKWGRTVAVASPSDTRSIYDIKLNAQLGVADVVALFDTDTGSPTLWHAQVMPGLTFTADPNRFRRQARVAFRVLDAGTALEGVRVRAGGEEGMTNADGVVRLELGPYRRRTTITATATKDGYTAARLKIRVRA